MTILATGVMDAVLVQQSWLVLAYFLFVNGFYLVLMTSSAVELRSQRRRAAGESDGLILASDLTPRVSVLVPAYNEAATIQQSTMALVTLDFPNLEIVVVDDGSRDVTTSLLVEAFELQPVRPLLDQRLATAEVETVYRSRRFPNLIVALKRNGGKADALNTALNLATGDLVCAVDADTIIDPDGLTSLVRPFIRNHEVVAAGATIRVVNDCQVRRGRVSETHVPHHALAGFQAVEYLRAFLFGRVGWNRLGGNLVISGAFGMFRRERLLDAGGYTRTVGEDMELIVRLRRQGYEGGTPARIEFVPDPVAWTEAPSSLRVLGRQRDRWHRGLSDVLWRHRHLFGNPRYGSLGMLAIPVFVTIEWLAPIVELVGLVSLLIGLPLGVVDTEFAWLFFAVAYGLGVLCSMFALLLEELSFRRYGTIAEQPRLVLWALLESLGYRQLTVVWRIRGIVGWLRGRDHWGQMDRRGFRGDQPVAS